MAQADGLYSVELDPELARQLASQGGTLLLLGVPQGTVFGIDQQVHLVGPTFKGVKMLPPGTHLVSYNTVSRQGDFSPTSSFFVSLKQSEVLVRTWDATTEQLLELADEDEVGRHAEGVRRYDFDSGLAPYNLNAYGAWKQLSAFIDPDTIARLAPAPNGTICITAEADPTKGASPTEAEQQLEEQLAERLSVDESSSSGRQDAAQPIDSYSKTQSSRGGRCSYTQICRLVKGKGLTPAELTAMNLDKSAALDSLIAEHYGGKQNAVLGELQFAFLAFLVGQSLEGFGQWKALLHLLLGCEKAPLQTRPKLYARLLTVLQAQLEHSLAPQPDSGQQAAPMGVPMVEELLADSFLQQLLQSFFGFIFTAGVLVDAGLRAAAEKLAKLLSEQLGWNFNVTELGMESNDEYAPVVVEL